MTDEALVLFDADEDFTDPDPEPRHPHCVMCGQPEAEGEFYGWGLWTGEWKGGYCTKCYLSDREETE